MLGAYTNILRCESAIATGDETWRAIAALMLPCYRNALKLAVGQWRGELIDYRCGLSAQAVRQYRGTLAGWDCRDINLVVEHISFARLDAPMRQAMNNVPTRFALPLESVDLAIEAGRTALRNSVAFREAVDDIRRHAGVGRKVAQARTSQAGVTP